MDNKEKFEDYTEQEFFDLLKNICDANAKDEAIINRWISTFEKVSQHPRGSDLIYYPEPGEDDSAQGILNSVKAWRAANGKPGFKSA